MRSLNLSFTEIAKRVGEKWQTLTPEEREPHESQAAATKELYNLELAKYKKTDEYKDYCNYLQEFKQRHTATNIGVLPQVVTHITVFDHMTDGGSDGKRPRLDTEPSNASSASTGSLQPAEGSNTAYDLFRYDSTNSHSHSPPSTHSPTPHLQGHRPPSSFRGGPSSSIQLPPLSQSLGPVPNPVTAGPLGATATAEVGTHRGVGSFRS